MTHDHDELDAMLDEALRDHAPAGEAPSLAMASSQEDDAGAEDAGDRTVIMADEERRLLQKAAARAVEAPAVGAGHDAISTRPTAPPPGGAAESTVVVRGPDPLPRVEAAPLPVLAPAPVTALPARAATSRLPIGSIAPLLVLAAAVAYALR